MPTQFQTKLGLVLVASIIALVTGCTTGSSVESDDSAPKHEDSADRQMSEQASEREARQPTKLMDKGQNSEDVGPPWPDNGAKLVEELTDEPYDLEPESEIRTELQKLVDETPDGGTVTIPDGIYAHGFDVVGRKNLTIRGEPGAVWIVEHRQNHGVVRINKSHNITVEGLGLLHDPKDRCSADALQVSQSHDITARNNDLSGSGVAGISASHSANLRFLDNHIHGATVYAADVYQSVNVEIAGNLIRENPRKYEGIWRQGIHIDDTFGDIVVTGNLIADNQAAPFTVELSESSDDSNTLTPANVHITDNVIARNKHPKLPSVSFRLGSDETGAYSDALGGIKVRGNCFDTRNGRDRMEAHVPDASEVTGNTLANIALTEAYQVTSPEACQIDVGEPFRWINRFDNRPPTPSHGGHGGDIRGAECSYER
jgi:hypothetical protein